MLTLFNGVKTVNVKILNRLCLNNCKVDCVVVCKLQAEICNEFYCCCGELNRVGSVAHDVGNCKTSIQNCGKHISVNIKTDVLDDDIGCLLRVDCACVLKFIEIVDELEQALDDIVRVRRYHNCCCADILKFYKTAVVNCCNNLAL